ncbi:hypothetical protein U1Q18_042447 [Sarracenia purpurea var. burkii]
MLSVKMLMGPKPRRRDPNLLRQSLWTRPSDKLVNPNTGEKFVALHIENFDEGGSSGLKAGSAQRDGNAVGIEDKAQMRTFG